MLTTCLTHSTKGRVHRFLPEPENLQVRIPIPITQADQHAKPRIAECYLNYFPVYASAQPLTDAMLGPDKHQRRTVIRPEMHGNIIRDDPLMVINGDKSLAQHMCHCNFPGELSRPREQLIWNASYEGSLMGITSRTAVQIVNSLFER